MTTKNLRKSKITIKRDKKLVYIFSFFLSNLFLIVLGLSECWLVTSSTLTSCPIGSVGTVVPNSKIKVTAFLLL